MHECKAHQTYQDVVDGLGSDLTCWFQGAFAAEQESGMSWNCLRVVKAEERSCWHSV